MTRYRTTTTMYRTSNEMKQTTITWIAAATNEVQTKEQEKYYMPSKLNQDHRLSPELELTVLDNLISSQ